MLREKRGTYMEKFYLAVDIVLLDENDKRIGNAVGYRASGTKGMDKKVYESISEDDLYARTGIQKQIFNTISDI